MKSSKIAKLAKRANKMLSRLEKKGYMSPAYKSAQGVLQALGARKRKETGRRFKESGYFKNKNEALQYETILSNFVKQKTATLKGYERYRERVWESAKQRFGIDESIMSQDEYMKIWENMPDNENDRMYGSDVVVAIVENVLKKQENTKRENEMSISEIVEKIQNSKDYKSAVKAVGVSVRDVNRKIKSIGSL